MDQRLLLLFFLIVPWTFFATAQHPKVGGQNRGLIRIEDVDGWQSDDADSKKVERPKRNITPTSDYDSIRPEGDESSAIEKKEADLPTCLLCVCLTGSVYCEEVSPEMKTVPALPKETAYLYARFNKITKITSKDFGDVATLKRIDLTGNLISEIEDRAFSKQDQLEELTLAENRLIKLPLLPPKLTLLNANHNKLKTKGMRATIFKKLNRLTYLYLGNNELEAVPTLPDSLRVLHLYKNNITSLTDETFCKKNDTSYIRHNLEEVRLDGNPVVLAQHPNSFICLKALPIGLYN